MKPITILAAREVAKHFHVAGWLWLLAYGAAHDRLLLSWCAALMAALAILPAPSYSDFMKQRGA